MSNIADIAMTINQIGRLQAMTLDPSNGGIGNRLNVAKKKLILVPSKQIKAMI